MSEKLTTSNVPESPQSILENKERGKEQLQNELLKYLGLDWNRTKSIDLTKAKELIESNSELFDTSRTPEFKKRLSSIFYQTSEFVSQVKETLGYTDADIEDILFEGVTQYEHSIRENLESGIRKFNLSKKFGDRVNDESVVQGLTDHSYISNLDYNVKKLADLGNKERAENIIKTAIRRNSLSDNCVSMGGWFVNVRGKLATIFDVDSFVKSPEMKAVALERVRKHLIDGNLSYIENWMKFSDLHANDIQKLEETEHYINTLFYAELPPKPEKGDDPFWGFHAARTNFYDLEKVKVLFDLPDEIYETDVFQERIKEPLFHFNSGGLFRNEDGADVKSKLKQDRVKTEVLNSTEFKTKLIEESCGLIQHGGDSGLDRAQELLNNFGVLKLSDPEFRKPLTDIIAKLLKQQSVQNVDIPKIVTLIHFAGISENDKKEMGIRLCIEDVKSISRGSCLKTIQEVLGVTFDVGSPEYISAAQEALIEALKNNDLRRISSLRFSPEFLARTEIKELAEHAISIYIQKLHWESVKELKSFFSFDDETIISIALKYLSNDQIITNADTDIEEEDDVEDVRDFLLSLQSIAPTLSAEHIRRANPKLQKYAEALQSKFPFITAEKSESLEFTIFLMETIDTCAGVFAALEKAPFLASAMEANPRFAIKLLRQYSKLDNLSQDNITFLYNAKSEIKLSGVSDELFFAEMNQRLVGYKNNAKVIEVYEKEDVDMDLWLNFPKKTEFNLVEGDESVSAVVLSENFERLGNSYKKYLGNIKSGVEEYKEELVTKRLPSIDRVELDAQISQMLVKKASAELSRDQKKANGIQKGIDNLEKQKENDKGISVWLKVTSEFSKVEQKLNNFLSLFEELKKEEISLKKLGELSGKKKGFPIFDMAFKDLEKKGQLPDSLKSSSTKKAQAGLVGNPYKKFFAQKVKVNELKKTTRESLDQFVKSFDSLNEWLTRDLSKFIGSERYSAIIQEAKQNLGLDGDHMESDIRTVKSFFNERKEGALDGRSMSISLWERDPDVDLYLGNYTDCCIRMDSEYHEAECVIADYLTDLGIQVAVVYDEKEKKPVLAAWLWVGKEKTTGEVSLVIDNIEANTDYTSQYSEVIGNKLREYIKSYSEAIGTDSVVQGARNNDLVVASIIENKSYKKIGGYNRADGYYLEAESD